MKVAVIGAGFGERVMAPIYREVGFDARVVSSRDPAGIARALESGIDLVSVHAPPFMHHDIVMAALSRGHAVLCDKPFGMNAIEARAMRDRARALGLPNFLNFEFRRQPSRVKLTELIRSGAIGDVIHVNWSFFGDGFRKQKHRWVFERESGGGWINANGSHAIDALRWIFDSEVAQCGGVARIENPSHSDRDGVARTATAEDAFSAWFIMDNGGTASMDTAYSASVPMPASINVMGSAGALEIVSERMILLRRPGRDDETFDFPPPAGDIHAPSLVPWLGAVRHALETGELTGPTFDDGVAVAEVMDTLRAGPLLQRRQG